MSQKLEGVKGINRRLVDKDMRDFTGNAGGENLPRQVAFKGGWEGAGSNSVEGEKQSTDTRLSSGSDVCGMWLNKNK